MSFLENFNNRCIILVKKTSSFIEQTLKGGLYLDEKKTVSEFIDMINSAEKMYLEKMDFIKIEFENKFRKIIKIVKN